MEEKYPYKNLLTGLFRQHDNAGKAYNAALKLGYTKDEVTILMSEETKHKYSHERRHPELSIEEEAIEGVGVGGALGVTTGAITGALMALGTFVMISGIGLAASGPIAVWLSGAAAGGIAGGLVGALINIGIATNHAEHFKTELKNGAILIILLPHSENDRKNLEMEWNNYDAIVLST
jgi:hypothetical protein